jgi:hypothetical protein
MFDTLRAKSGSTPRGDKKLLGYLLATSGKETNE